MKPEEQPWSQGHSFPLSLSHTYHTSSMWATVGGLFRQLDTDQQAKINDWQEYVSKEISKCCCRFKITLLWKKCQCDVNVEQLWIVSVVDSGDLWKVRRAKRSYYVARLRRWTTWTPKNWQNEQIQTRQGKQQNCKYGLLREGQAGPAMKPEVSPKPNNRPNTINRWCFGGHLFALFQTLCPSTWTAL